MLESRSFRFQEAEVNSAVMTVREVIEETVNQLFVFTDNRDWVSLMNQVFHHEVHLDMTSMGGEAKMMTAQEICDMWDTGFQGIDEINHLAGNFLVKSLSDTEAHVFCYATATHFKAAATQGKVREFVGTYDITLVYTASGWRIDSLAYHLKYMNGNIELN